MPSVRILRGCCAAAWVNGSCGCERRRAVRAERVRSGRLLVGIRRGSRFRAANWAGPLSEWLFFFSRFCCPVPPPMRLRCVFVFLLLAGPHLLDGSSSAAAKAHEAAKEELVVQPGQCDGVPKKTIPRKTLEECEDELRFAGTAYSAAQYLKARTLCWLIVEAQGLKEGNPKYQCIRRKADAEAHDSKKVKVDKQKPEKLWPRDDVTIDLGKCEDGQPFKVAHGLSVEECHLMLRRYAFEDRNVNGAQASLIGNMDCQLMYTVAGVVKDFEKYKYRCLVIPSRSGRGAPPAVLAPAAAGGTIGDSEPGPAAAGVETHAGARYVPKEVLKSKHRKELPKDETTVDLGKCRAGTVVKSKTGLTVDECHQWLRAEGNDDGNLNGAQASLVEQTECRLLMDTTGIAKDYEKYKYRCILIPSRHVDPPADDTAGGQPQEPTAPTGAADAVAVGHPGGDAPAAAPAEDVAGGADHGAGRRQAQTGARDVDEAAALGFAGPDPNASSGLLSNRELAVMGLGIVGIVVWYRTSRQRPPPRTA